MKKRDFIEVEKVKNSLNLVRQNLSEHLSAINENTSELQSLFDFIQEIDQKINKLSERIDQVQLQTHQEKDKPYVESLSATEKKLFLVLYTEEDPLNCLDLSHKSEVPFSIIREHLNSLSKKGITINRTFNNNQTFYKLDPGFRDWQAKNNIINLSLEAFQTPKQKFQTKLKTYYSETFNQ